MRKKLMVFAVLLVCALSMGTALVCAGAANPDAVNIIRAELDLRDTNIDWASAGQKDKIFYVASPFGNTLGSLRLNLQKGDRLRYSFYTPTPFAGMGGLEMQIVARDAMGSEQWVNISPYYKTGNVVDQNGLSGFLADDIVTALGNGWYERSIAFPDALFDEFSQIQLWHMFLAGAVDTDELLALKEKGESLVMYYKNFIFESGKNQTAIFDEVTGGAYFDNWAGLNFGDASINSPVYKGFSYYFAVGLDLQLELVADPDPLTIRLSQSELFFNVGDAYALLDFVETQGVTVQSVIFEDNTDCTPAAGERFTPEKEGVYTVTFVKEDGVSRVVLPIQATAYAAEMPVILAADLPEPKDGTAGERYDLPAVTAYYHGEKNHPTTVTVTRQKADGTTVNAQVHTDGDAYYFVPDEKVEAVYTVTYTATKDTFVFNKSIDVQVIDYDFPTADFSAWPKNIEIGSEYRLPVITIADPYDGAVTLTSDGVSPADKGITAQFTVYNSYNEPVAVQDGKIRPTVSGLYTVVVTCCDSDKNEREYTYSLVVDAIADAVYTVRMKIGEEDRKQGRQKRFMATTQRNFSGYIPIQNGDKLVYDVYSDTPMAGIGSFSGQFFEGGDVWTYFHNYYTGIKDSNGESMVPTADISRRLKDENGDPVWYHREVELTGSLVGKNIAHFSPVIDTTAACGEEIRVQYRNVYLLRRGGTKIPVLPGTKPLDVNVWDKTGATEAYFQATLDPTPVLLTQFMPENGETGEDIYIGKEVVFDYSKNCAVPLTSVKMYNAAGQEVTLRQDETGYIFNTKVSGRYTIAFTCISGGKEYRLEHALVLKDTTPPTIQLSDYAQTVTAGSSFRIPTATVFDAVTDASALSLKVRVFLDSREVAAPDNTIANAAAGQYMVVYTCTDAAGNETVERIYIEAVAKKGCGSVLSAGSGLLAGIALLLGLLLLVRRKSASAENSDLQNR